MWAKNTNQNWWSDIILLTLLLGLFYFFLLGSRPLFVPDEGRYAEIAREMVTSGNFITPYLNDIKYFEKPVLFYWLTAAAIKAFGVNIWAVRIPSALLGLFGCLFTYITIRKLYDRVSGLLAAFILSTSALYFVMSHMVSLDLPVTIFISSTLYAFLLGVQEPKGTSRRLWLWCAAVFAGLAVLTKGLIGIVFPGMIIVSWIALTGQWALLGQLYLPSCILIFFLVAAPWHLLVGHRNPEFFYFYFIEQQFLRYTQKDIGHYQPVWFFIPAFIAGFFPWIVFLPQTIANAIKNKLGSNNPKKYLELFFLLWFGLIFLFFSFSKSKLIPYILPTFPPVAILTARYFVSSWENHKRLGIGLGLLALLLLIGGLGYFAYQFTHGTPLPDTHLANITINIAIVVLFVGTVLALFTLRNLKLCLSLLILATAIFLLSLLAAFPAIDSRTILPLANTLKPLLTPQTEVITYGQYFQDLPFYLSRRVTIVNWQNELTFGMEHQDTQDWMIDDNQFKQRLQGNKRLFVVMSKDSLDQWQKTHPAEKLFLVDETLTNVLVSNQQH